MIGRTKFCSSEDSARYHASEPAARNDDVLKDFSGNPVVTAPGQLVDTLPREAR